MEGAIVGRLAGRRADEGSRKSGGGGEKERVWRRWDFSRRPAQGGAAVESVRWQVKRIHEREIKSRLPDEAKGINN